MQKNEIDAYLERISFFDPVDPKINTLRRLHRTHIQKVPFETLDLFFHKPFTILYLDLFTKIVLRKRGGYCYELNGLFSHLLAALGFNISIHNGVLFDSIGILLPKSRHMLLIVHLEKRWVADVGYGNGFLEPLCLDNPEPQCHGNRTFRCRQNGSESLVEESFENHWRPLYSFTFDPKQISDFEERNQFHQTNPESVFYRKRVCMISNPDASLELIGNTLSRTTPYGTHTIQIEERNISSLLAADFGLEFSSLHNRAIAR